MRTRQDRKPNSSVFLPDRRQETLIKHMSALNNRVGTYSLVNTTGIHVLITAELTSSAEIDRPANRSGAFQRAGGQLLSDVQVTHLEQSGKEHFFPQSRYSLVSYLFKN